MRTASVLTILMMIPILFAGVALASPPTNGTTTTVSDSQTWNGGNFNGDVIVASGGVLTWTGESQISTDSTITESQVNDIISVIIDHTEEIDCITIPGLI